MAPGNPGAYLFGFAMLLSLSPHQLIAKSKQKSTGLLRCSPARTLPQVLRQTYKLRLTAADS